MLELSVFVFVISLVIVFILGLLAGVIIGALTCIPVIKDIARECYKNATLGEE